MKALIIPVNNEAHSRALEALFGPEKSQEFLKAYQAIDKAMLFGYERGCKETLQNLHEMTAEEAEPHYEAGTIAGRAAGYTAGYLAAEEAYHQQAQNDTAKNLNDSYNDGYVDGVSDARVMPEEADRVVAGLCGEDDFEDSFSFNDYYDDIDEEDIADLKATF